jgi:hypothetical protein
MLIVAGIRQVHSQYTDELSGATTSLIAYTVLGAILVLSAIVMSVILGDGPDQDIPIKNLTGRVWTVTFIGYAVLIPWFALASYCQDRCRLEVHRTALTDGSEEAYVALASTWQSIVSIVSTFAVGVAAALLTTGALRFAFLEAHPECAPGYDPTKDKPLNGECKPPDFPALDVLLYGAVFALIGLAIAIPLLWAWRQRANDWVNKRLALQQKAGETAYSSAYVEERERLEKLLHLDTSILRSPVTALSVFTPLVTSLLGAFLPELAG